MTMYFIFVVALGLLVWLCIQATTRKSRIVATILFVGLAIGTPYVYWDTLSRPKSLTDEIRDDKEVKVLAYHAISGTALYFWLKLPDVREPRYYVMPWNDEARKLVQQLQDGKDSGQQMMLALPFEKSYETEKKVYPIPQPIIPMKETPPKVREFDA